MIWKGGHQCRLVAIIEWPNIAEMELHDWLVFKSVLRDWPKSGVILHCCGKFHSLGLGSAETQKLFGGFLLVKLCCLSFHLSLTCLTTTLSLVHKHVPSFLRYFMALFFSLSHFHERVVSYSLSYSLTFPLSLDTRHISRYLVLLKGHQTKTFSFSLGHFLSFIYWHKDLSRTISYVAKISYKYFATF